MCFITPFSIYMCSKSFQQRHIVWDNPIVVKFNTVSLDKVPCVRTAPILHKAILTNNRVLLSALWEELGTLVVFHARAFLIQLTTRAMHHKFIDKTIT